MTAVVVHQPEYLPCTALLWKIAQGDVLVLLDDVQFNRASLQHRAKIAGPRWLTIPFVHRFPQDIHEVEIVAPLWADGHRRVLTAVYGDTLGFTDMMAALATTLTSPSKFVADVAEASMRAMLPAFGLDIPILRSSSLSIPDDIHKGNRVLAICQRLRATRYVSGHAGSLYLDPGAFAAAGIEVVVPPPVPMYPRPRPFVPGEDRGLSAVDAWAFMGSDAAFTLFRKVRP